MLISSEHGRTGPVIDKEKSSDYDLPLGQRFLKAGYKVITTEQLEERFCCDKITEGEIKKAREKIDKQVQDFRASKWWRKNTKFKIENLPSHEASLGRTTPFLRRYSFIRAVNKSVSKTIDESYLECILETESIDDYVATTIPERCLESLKKARQIGMTHFNVIYPILGHKRFKDPVIVGASNDKFDPMYEIDFWE
jgi:hypothetical protein